jgi:uncharacterized membrane protein YdjX (TVP38/TMEM64 family)
MKKRFLPYIIVSVIIVTTFIIFKDTETYFTELLNSLTANVSVFALVSFCVLTSDIILPVPSSIIMYLNGFVLGPIMGSLVSLVSLLISAIIGYYIGRFTSIGLKKKSEKNAHTLLSKYGALSILITRGIPILSESICFVCGYNKVPFKHYFIYNIIGYIPLCLLYSVCGSLGYDKNIFFVSFCCSLLISVAFWLFGKRILITKHKVNE